MNTQPIHLVPHIRIDRFPERVVSIGREGEIVVGEHNEFVSRIHGYLTFSRTCVVFVDSSRNGTTVNGKHIESGGMIEIDRMAEFDFCGSRIVIEILQ